MVLPCFVAVCGLVREHRDRVLDVLKDIYIEQEQAFVACSDKSSGCAEKFSHFLANGHQGLMTSAGLISFFWSRLDSGIVETVQPALLGGKSVLMDGFGMKIWAHAIARAEDGRMHALCNLHKANIETSIVDRGIPKPVYLIPRIRDCEEVKHILLPKDVSRTPVIPSGMTLDTFLSRLIWAFDNYQKYIDGQRVIYVDAEFIHHDDVSEKIKTLLEEIVYDA